MTTQYLLFFLLLIPHLIFGGTPNIQLGSDLLFDDEYAHLLRNKKIGLITNHTGVNSQMIPTRELLKAQAKNRSYTVTAFFAPEHGLTGKTYASEDVADARDVDGIPIFSLHGKNRRPSPEMLKNVTLLIYDIQDIGSRSYTYITTLFYVMEEAARHDIPLIVLDRPNPINGIVVDGPMMEKKWHSMVGYINVPYCHGMTVGELALYFNSENNVRCKLTVVPMKDWKRGMSFVDTGLFWIPTSPNVPEATTPFYYPMTGMLGELQIASIGVGYTLPFKIMGTPWIEAEPFAKKLNEQNFPGVTFLPFHFRPFFGRFAKEDCQGVQIVVTNPLTYKPVSTCFLIFGILKYLYPEKMKEVLAKSNDRKEMFCKVTGTEEIYKIITEKENIVWKLRAVHQKEREGFLRKREKYLIASYN
jgi:uncharacterized protein YbbC (DUF1343 family)